MAKCSSGSGKSSTYTHTHINGTIKYSIEWEHNLLIMPMFARLLTLALAQCGSVFLSHIRNFAVDHVASAVVAKCSKFIIIHFGICISKVFVSCQIQHDHWNATHSSCWTAKAYNSNTHVFECSTHKHVLNEILSDCLCVFVYSRKRRTQQRRRQWQNSAGFG